jgi:hypothetical protein
MKKDPLGPEQGAGTRSTRGGVFAAVATPQRRLADRRFYVGMTLVLFAIVIAGFAPGIVKPDTRLAPLTWMVGLHGLIFTAWLVLFVVQTVLITSRKAGLHRRLGMAGGFLAVLMVVTGYTTAVAMARRGFDLSGDLNAAADPMMPLVFQLGDLVTFGVLVGLGVAYRRRAAIHKRMMFLATVGGLMSAPLAHAIGHIPLLRDKGAVILLPLVLLWLSHAVYDRISFGRIHPVSLWGAVAIFAWSNLRAALIGPSAGWHQFAAWLVD